MQQQNGPPLYHTIDRVVQPYRGEAHVPPPVHGPYHINTVITSPMVMDLQQHQQPQQQQPGFYQPVETDLNAIDSVPRAVSFGGMPSQSMLPGQENYVHAHGRPDSDPTSPTSAIMQAESSHVDGSGHSSLKNMTYGMPSSTTMEENSEQSGDKHGDVKIESGTVTGTDVDGLDVPVKGEEKATRETWDTKVDFLLAVIGFAVDLGNVWRFPYVCYRNGGVYTEPAQSNQLPHANEVGQTLEFVNQPVATDLNAIDSVPRSVSFGGIPSQSMLPGQENYVHARGRPDSDPTSPTSAIMQAESSHVDGSGHSSLKNMTYGMPSSTMIEENSEQSGDKHGDVKIESGTVTGTDVDGLDVPVKGEEKATRETWDTKVEFSLAITGFAVDLGNVWRFPYVCYRNGGVYTEPAQSNQLPHANEVGQTLEFVNQPVATDLNAIDSVPRSVSFGGIPSQSMLPGQENYVHARGRPDSDPTSPTSAIMQAESSHVDGSGHSSLKNMTYGMPSSTMIEENSEQSGDKHGDVKIESGTVTGTDVDGLDVPVKGEEKATRETWDTKVEFSLAITGFAVDLGNVWRFPYVCYRNGGGAFLIPYLVMYIFGGLPLFYLELALGQFQRSGCLTVWKRICPMFCGIGFSICIIASYTAWYYNTVMSWALFYMFDAMRPHLPWDSCNNWWNTDACVTVYEKLVNSSAVEQTGGAMGLVTRLLMANATDIGSNDSLKAYSSTEEYFYRRVLQLQNASGYNDVGPVRWEISLCLLAIFTIVYFSLWKGVKSSGKAVWVTATLPYVILFILLIRGLTLEGSLTGIKYYLTPDFSSLLRISVWSDAAAQIFFSLGPGFGVLLALSSYNKFHNNCYRDAMVTSFINCATSFLSGFVVFSVLGHMCLRMHKTMEAVANEGPGLVFIAYPEAIATLRFSTFWAIMFMLMLITLGLDSTFGGLEAIITAVLDWIPSLRKRRELFVLAVIVYCFLGALATTTCGGYLILSLLDQHGASISILFIVFCECVALCWFYGTKRFCQDIKLMLGYTPGRYWQVCWTFISPVFLLGIFIANIVYYEFRKVDAMGVTYEPDLWVKIVGWMIVFSAPIFIPIMMVYQFICAKGSLMQRFRYLTTPEERPLDENQRIPMVMISSTEKLTELQESKQSKALL